MKRDIREFIEALSSEKGYSLNTCRGYKNDLMEFCNYLTESNLPLDLQKIDALVIRSYLAFLHKKDKKTSIASAEVTDKSPVGGCKPGMSPSRFVITKNIHNVAINGIICRPCSGATSKMPCSIASKIPSMMICNVSGSIFICRVANQAKQMISSIMPQLAMTEA